MDLKKALTKYSEIVQSWSETPFDDMYMTYELMKDLSVIKDYLVRHKIIYKKQWMSIWYKYHITDGKSNAASEQLANKEVPELDHLRQLIKSAT